MSRVSRLQIPAGRGGNGPAFSGVPSHLWTHHLTYFRRQSSPNQPQPPPPSPPASSSSSSHGSSPTLLLVFVAVAAVLFASGLLHLLIRFLKKRGRLGAAAGGSADLSSGGRRSPSAIQRQLQQLFTLHDTGGLDQASIDALPEFVYTELRGAADGPPGEPLDCAVCLCEFSPTDRLRLLPACGHAFHLACIDAWLTSSSTCPLCRGAAISLQDAEFDLEDDWRDLEEASVGEGNDDEKVVFPVRLGKFRSVQGAGTGAVAVADVKQGHDDDNNNGNDNDTDNGGDITKDEGEATTSSCGWKIDERRCFSMGSYQYVLRDSALRLPLTSCGRDAGRGPRRRAAPLVSGSGLERGRLSVVAKGESFSVSKIWQWSNNKGQYPFPAVPSNAAPVDEKFSRCIQEQHPEGR